MRAIPMVCWDGNEAVLTFSPHLTAQPIPMYNTEMERPKVIKNQDLLAEILDEITIAAVGDGGVANPIQDLQGPFIFDLSSTTVLA